MKLKHITFTGVDIHTDLKALKEIQNEYPYVEWGILMSKNWRENGPRYFNPEGLLKLRRRDLNLSCHLCGSVARDVVRNSWVGAFNLTCGRFKMFQRCQINVSGQQSSERTQFVRTPVFLHELIIQQKSDAELTIFNAINDRRNISVLLDASGGRGIDTPIKPLNIPGLKVGYAGGINPENVAEKLSFLMENEQVGEFWIDMESGVRTDDLF